MKEFEITESCPFRPCITNPGWLVCRRIICGKQIKKCITLIFGCDGARASIYREQNPGSILDGLVESEIAKLDYNSLIGFCYWFEFDGEKFEVCDKEPKWAQHDCGIIRENLK